MTIGEIFARKKAFNIYSRLKQCMLILISKPNNLTITLNCCDLLLTDLNAFLSFADVRFNASLEEDDDGPAISAAVCLEGEIGGDKILLEPFRFLPPSTNTRKYE